MVKTMVVTANIRFHISLLLFFLFVLGVCHAEGNQQTDFTFSGYTINKLTDEYVPNVKVTFTKTPYNGKDKKLDKVKKIFETFSDETGRYQFVLKKGNYKVSATHPDFNRIHTGRGSIGVNELLSTKLNIYLYTKQETIEVDIVSKTLSIDNTYDLKQLKPKNPLLDKGEGGKIRLGIFKFSQNINSKSVSDTFDSFIDLLTVKLSQKNNLEVVERQTIDRILDEVAIGYSNKQPEGMVLQAGKLANADIAITCSAIDKDNSSAVVVRIMDIRNGIVRDIFIVPLAKGTIAKNVDRAAIPIGNLQNTDNDFNNKTIIAIGSFEDESVADKYEGIDTEIRRHLQKYYTPKTPVVERVLISPLLMELEMGMGGFTNTKANHQPTAQPAIMLIDGIYKSFRKEEDMISLTLRAHQIGGPLYYTTINCSPGENLDKQLIYATDQLLEKTKTTRLPTNLRKREALAHLQHAIELAGGKQNNFNINFKTEILKKNFPDKVIPAFNSALALMPEYRNIVWFYKGQCYAKLFNYNKQFEFYKMILSNACSDALKLRIADSWNSFNYQSPMQKEEVNKISYDIYYNLAIKETDDKKRYNLLRKKIYISQALFQSKTITIGDHDKNIEGFYSFLSEATIRQCDANMKNYDGYLGPYLTFIKEYYTNDNIHVDNNVHRLVSLRKTNKQVEKKYPLLMPYFKALYIINQEPSKTMKKNLSELVQYVSQDHFRIFSYNHFCMYYLPGCLNWASANSYCDLTIKIGESIIKEIDERGKVIKNYEDPKFVDRIKIVMADCYCLIGNYKNALEILKQVGDPNTEFPNKSNLVKTQKSFASATVALAKTKCEKKLGIVNNTIAKFKIPLPIQTFNGTASFDTNNNEIWFSIGTRIAKYDYLNNKLTTKALLKNTRQAIKKIEIGSDNIFLSNMQNGFYIYNKQKSTVDHITEREGLPLPRVSALYYTPSKLWLGFSGWHHGGDIGFWDISEKKYLGVASKRRKTTGAYRSEKDPVNGPPHNPVVDINQSSVPGVMNLLIAVQGKGLQMYNMKNSYWFTANATKNLYDELKRISDNENQVSCVTADDEFLAVGCIEASGRSGHDSMIGGLSITKNFPIFLDAKDWKIFNLNEGLPNGNVLSLAISPQKELWVGGENYLAVIDLKKNRIDRICDLDKRVVSKIQIFNNELWILTHIITKPMFMGEYEPKESEIYKLQL